jgi:hypothetical protein
MNSEYKNDHLFGLMEERNMKKYILLVPVFLGAIVWGTIGWWQTARSEPLNDSQSPVERLNVRARAAKDDDVASIENLATALVANLIPVDLPDDAKATIHSRLVAAELDHRRGRDGIPEANVMRTVNHLAREFGVPEYAKTSLSQVRLLRGSMTGVFPDLLVPQRIHPNKLKEPSSQQPLSPMGAALITALLLQQKLINEEFQVEPKDWRGHLQKKNAAVWRTYRQNKGVATTPGSRLSSRPEGAKTRELRQLIADRIATMTHADIVNLTSATLDQLGIPR